MGVPSLTLEALLAHTLAMDAHAATGTRERALRLLLACNTDKIGITKTFSVRTHTVTVAIGWAAHSGPAVIPSKAWVAEADTSATCAMA